MHASEFKLLEELAADIMTRGQIDRDSVEVLERHFAPSSVIDQSKADLLFRINAAVQLNPRNCSTWQPLFIHSICRYIVFDMNSPGEIAECESAWLRGHLPDNRDLSSIETGLVREIEKTARSVCEKILPLFERAKRAEPTIHEPVNSQSQS